MVLRCDKLQSRSVVFMVQHKTYGYVMLRCKRRDVEMRQCCCSRRREHRRAALRRCQAVIGVRQNRISGAKSSGDEADDAAARVSSRRNSSSARRRAAPIETPAGTRERTHCQQTYTSLRAPARTTGCSVKYSYMNILVHSLKLRDRCASAKLETAH